MASGTTSRGNTLRNFGAKYTFVHRSQFLLNGGGTGFSTTGSICWLATGLLWITCTTAIFTENYAKAICLYRPPPRKYSILQTKTRIYMQRLRRPICGVEVRKRAKEKIRCFRRRGWNLRNRATIERLAGLRLKNL